MTACIVASFLLFSATTATAEKSEKLSEYQFKSLFFDALHDSQNMPDTHFATLICNRNNNAELCDDNGCNIEKVKKECFVFDTLHYEKNMLVFIQQGLQFFVLLRLNECMYYVGAYDLWTYLSPDDIRALVEKAVAKIKQAPCVLEQ